jgi:DNA-directed RNA polymerase subunit K/omega
MKENILQEYHTELKFRSSEEVQQMAQVIRNIHGEIVDPFHRTIPLLTKYERARVLGERARQLEEGAEPFVPVPAEVIDSYTIAEMELKEKAIPFIIERPLPHGGCEFWRLCDLETM